MTFYNIIFGLLFVASLREVVVALVNDNGPFWEAAALALLVFSDVIYTSHVIEEHKCSYTVWMKLLDLGNFLILACALLVLNPAKENLLQVSLELPLKELFGEPMPLWPFWALLTVYWLGLTVWVGASAVHPDDANMRRTLDAVWPDIPRSCRAAAAWMVRFGRVIGLCVLTATTVLAVLVPAALKAAGVCVFWLAVFNLLFTAIVFKTYDTAGVD